MSTGIVRRNLKAIKGVLINRYTTLLHQASEMAPNGGKPELLLTNNDVLTLVGDRYKHILIKIGSDTQDQIVDLLIEDEDEAVLLETREIVFKKAISKYALRNGPQTDGSGTSIDLKKIELKQRKGERKLASNAKDIYELYCYYVELKSDFPKDCLRCNGTYLDITATPRAQSNISHKNDVSDTQKLRSYEDIIEKLNLAEAKYIAKNQELSVENEDLRRQVQNIRAHLLSVEKLFFDELRAVKSVSESNKSAINELKSGPSQNKPPSADENNRSRPGSQTQQTGESDATQGSSESRQSQQSESSGAETQADPDPSRSFTQIMRDAVSTSDDESDKESVYVETESSPMPPAGNPTAPKHQPKSKSKAKVDQSTSPTHTRFVDNNKSKSSIKKPTHRPKQTDVRDMKSDSNSESISDNEGEWEEVSYKNKNKKKSSNKSDTSGLRGIKSEPFAELYLTNIARNENKSFSDIAEDIRKYGRSKGFRIMSAWVVSNRVTDDMVGCKLRVPTRQVDDMLGNRAWPDGIMCKRWERRERAEKSDPPFTAYRSQQSGYNQRSRSSSSRRREASPRRRSTSRGSVRGRSTSRNSRQSRSNSQRRTRRDWFDERY